MDDDVFFFFLFKHVHQKIWSGVSSGNVFLVILTLKAPIMTAADDTFCDSLSLRYGISRETSASRRLS